MNSARPCRGRVDSSAPSHTLASKALDRLPASQPAASLAITGSRCETGVRVLCLGLLALLGASCEGIFQRRLPEIADRYARHAVGELSVGAGEADITPKTPQYLGGFDLNRVSNGVHLPLKARAMVLKVGEVKVALVGIDNLGLQRGDVDWIKSGLLGFTNGDVFICSSHTHAAPDLVGLWGYYFMTSGRDREYLALVRRGVIAAVRQAEAGLRPARLLRGSAILPREGLVRNSNRKGVFDRRMTVIQAVEANSGAPIASLLNFGCHPEALRRSNLKISADFVGDLCDRWSDAGLGQPVFINGALGAMVTPRLHGEEGLVEMGAALFEVGKRALAVARPVLVNDIEIARRDVYMPMRSLSLSVARQFMLIQREVYEGSLRSTVGYLRIGEIEAVALPGEPEPGFAQRIRSLSHRPDLLIFSLADDEVGYLMSARDARMDDFQYERGMSPGPEAGEQVLQALVGK